MLRIFDETFGAFAGTGFSPAPLAGQLDSDIYSITGLSDGDLAFGGTATAGDFARGLDLGGGVSTGGIYAFDLGGDIAFGFQAAGTDLTPGTITLRIENVSGAEQSAFTLAYDLLFNNDAERANSLNVEISTDGLTFTRLSALDFVSPEASDALGFQSVRQTATFTTAPVAAGGALFVRFVTDDVSGAGSRDEFGLDDIVVEVAGGAVLPVVRINEIRISSSGASDDVSNYVELFGTPGTSLAGLTLVVLSGEFQPGQVDFAFRLDDVTFDENGIALIANAAIATAIAQAELEASDLTASFDLFGSPTSFLLVSGFTGAAGDDLDADNDGVLDGTFFDALVDSVSLTDADATPDTNYSDTIVGPDGAFAAAHVFRPADGAGSFVIGSFGDLSADTPGTLNAVVPPPPPPPAPVSLVINEVLFDPAAGADGDANRDGIRDAAADEFIEIVNTGIAAADISGFTLSDDDGGAFVFPAGTILAPGQAAVLFGGGTPTGDFGGALVFTDDGTIGTGLANGGDIVELRDASGTLIDSFAYGSAGDIVGGSDQSVTRDPDLFGGFADHLDAEGAGGARFSPGTRVDGTPFGPGIIFAESFEAAPGTTYLLSAQFDDGGFDFFGRFAAPDTANAARDDFTAGFDGGFAIFGQDHDGDGFPATQTISLPGIDISAVAASDLAFSVALGALNSAPAFLNYEAGDGIRVFATIDGGARTLVAAFAAPAGGGDLRQDTDLDGIGDGTVLTTALGEFLIDLPDGGSLLTLDFELTSTDSFEPLVVDNVRVGDANALAADDGPAPREFIAAAIFDIQGAAHISPLAGEDVRTTGIVTTVTTNGFYLQDAAGDGNLSTSDGIFVFTGAAPGVAVGDDVTVEGEVQEFLPQNNANNLTVTNIADVFSVTVNSSGNALPAAVIIGAGGLLPPTETVVSPDELPVDLNNPASVATNLFDPASDGADFYEALEGQLVTISNPQVVGETNNFGEIFVVAENGAGATGINAGGGIQLTASDVNPERIQIDDALFAGGSPGVSVGDRLADITGVVSYSFGNFEILPTVAPEVVAAAANAPEVTSLVTSGGNLSIASYNVLNLDPNDSDGDTDVADGRFAAIAEQLVNNLSSPDIIALQEVQDGSGSVSGDGVLSAAATLQLLIDAIAAAGGPRYEFFEVAPESEFATGGEPGGNIRVAYLYNPERVSLVEDESFALTPDVLSAVGADPSTFAGTRSPLVGTFEFAGEQVTLVNNHFTSRGGSDALFGADQPPTSGGETRRLEQATAISAFVASLLAANPDAQVSVLGDLNEFEFGTPLGIIEGTANGGPQVLFNQVFDIDESADRYSFNFEGNSQQIDHLLVTANLDAITSFDTLQLNVGLFGAIASDHNPLLGSVAFFDNSIAGSDLADRLFATSLDDFIEGNGGNDLIFAEGGDDYVNSGDGDDTVFAGLGDDRVDGGAGDDRIFGSFGNDRLNGGDGNDRLDGGLGDDVLSDGAGDDHVLGGLGNDRFILGSGNDTIIAGFGQDTVEAAPGFGNDRVAGFNTRTDLLDLTAFGINGLQDALSVATQFRGSTVFDFGDEGVLTLQGVRLDRLTDDNFVGGDGVLATAIAADAFVFGGASGKAALLQNRSFPTFFEGGSGFSARGADNSARAEFAFDEFVQDTAILQDHFDWDALA